MKIRGFALSALFALVISLLNVLPAQASMVRIPVSVDTSNAIGLIVTYKPGVNALAPNGETTGENFAGVPLDNPVNLGGSMFAADFSRDLNSNQAAAALAGIENDPRVATVEFNRFINFAAYAPQPIQPLIIPKSKVVEFPIVLKTGISRASLAPITATDAWLSGATPRVTISWTKPATGYSGTLLGYRVDIYNSGSWHTLKSQTTPTTYSYTTSSSYLTPGTASRFRVAALTRKSGVTYVGYYKYVDVTPTTAPKSINSIQLVNNIGQLQVSWTPYSSLSDKGGLDVTYAVGVTKPDGTTVDCVISAPNSCSATSLTSGTVYTATVTVTNAHGSVSFSRSISFSSATPVNPANDPSYSQQWYLKSSEAYSAKVSGAWATESGLDSVVVAVLDTGYTDHPDLPASTMLSGYDMISSATNARDGDGRDANAHDEGDWNLSTPENSSWHGTHVAGIIAAADNNLGVVGVAPNVKILPVRVLGADGGSSADIIAGIKWAAGIRIAGVPDNTTRVSVINMSIGGQSSCDSATESALAAAKAAGITVVTAAGNDNNLASGSYPGNCYPTINVGSTGRDGRPAFYSNYSNPADQFNNTSYGVDISAPGGDFCQGGQQGQIYSTLNTGLTVPVSPTYGWEIGTSMASPEVAGIVALMYSAKLRQNPSTVLNGTFVDSIWHALSTTTTPFHSQVPTGCVGSTPRNPTDGSQYGGYGAGIVNAEAALAAILR